MVPFSITLLFRILNFLMLVALGVYVFWRYFYTSLRAQMATRQAALAHLNDRKNTLAQEQSALDDALIEQEKKNEALRKKLQEWRTHVSAAMQMREREHETIHERLVESMRKRRAIMTQALMQKTVIPQAIQNAREQLQSLYDDPNRGERYMASIFKRMK